MKHQAKKKHFTHGISDADINAALEDMHTYIDVSKSDLATIYRFALQHAYERLSERQKQMEQKAKKTFHIDYADLAWSVTGAAIGVGLCALLSTIFFQPHDMTLLIASFGASAVLIYGAVKSPLAQPRNLVGGNFVSAVAGVLATQLFDGNVLIAAPLAVALALALMMITKTLHPPGGSTALVAVIGGEKIQALGFLYPFVPVAIGTLVLLLVALLINNLSPHRKYPETWL
jgi:CBS-domain-containing membrane protein